MTTAPAMYAEAVSRFLLPRGEVRFQAR
jgi:hypothetical protein